MAIIRPSPIVGAISGSLGGQTFVNSKTGLIARIRTHHRPNQAANLLAQHTRFATVSRRWRTITTQDREAWKALARQSPQTNRLGVTSPRTGYGLYLAVNLNSIRQGGLFLAKPPVDALTTIDLDQDTVFQFPNIAQTVFTRNATTASARIQIWGSRHFSTIIPKWPPPYRIIFERKTTNLPFFLVQYFNQWEQIFGRMETGETYSLKFVYYDPASDLFPRPPILFEGTVLPAP